METFKEYIKKRGWNEDMNNPATDDDVARTLSQVALQNPKIVPGATDQKTVARAMLSKPVQALMQKNPTAVGKLGAAMTGDKKQTPDQNNSTNS
jgi:hypothetical protein